MTIVSPTANNEDLQISCRINALKSRTISRISFYINYVATDRKSATTYLLRSNALRLSIVPLPLYLLRQYALGVQFELYAV